MRLESPSPRVWRAFKGWTIDESPLLEIDDIVGDDPSDLVALRPPFDDDNLSRILHKYGGYASYLLKQPKFKPGEGSTDIHYFSEDHISRMMTITSVLAATVLMVGAIVSLYFVKQPGAKLGMVCAFTFLFAASMVLLTNARRGETFAATAAYAAVLVVFVSGDLGIAEPVLFNTGSLLEAIATTFPPRDDELYIYSRHRSSTVP
ncbi:hypothetical protein AJ80_00594 [Polytolypa hystricis UAMH7299]|uniref:DUF6594 domain-containing protein n=1 Tax=Polytolypa hystricis (strain UAMH7299) TaxID=1447883 RepID=A0A2B7Z1J6_POLH7|nr:hypothetical protein AJ80_00594 [Polytolypa hystricis UAMH7299]